MILISRSDREYEKWKSHQRYDYVIDEDKYLFNSLDLIFAFIY